MPLHITYFVHGTTTDNELDLATGWAPGELSALGIAQSKKLGELVRDQKFAAVFCSDLARAIDSATLAFGDRYQIITDARLREANYGDFTGAAAASFKNNLVDYVERPFPHGESYRDVEKRMTDFVRDAATRYPDAHVAIVAHQAPQLALDVLLRGKNWTEAIAEDWRHTKAWQPGWKYRLN